MEVFITGGSGFVGRALCQGLLAQGHGVTVLSRSSQAAQRLPPGVVLCLGDPGLPGPWQDQAARCQGFINLAGASIFERWSVEHKRLILESRVNSTRHLVQALGRRAGTEPAILVSASAVGYYGFRGDEELDEDSPAGDDFLARVCQQWETQALEAENLGARVVRARFGIVLGDKGGALEKMLPLFRLGLGGVLGSGRQWFSWIHQRDLVNALLLCLCNPQARGAVNCTAPQPVTNRDLAKALGRALHRPAFLPVPGLAVELALGEFGSVLLEGQRVLPRRLTALGFGFAFPLLDQALADLAGRA
jgi:uncharacterized protein (TIGR01777 family)